MNAFKELKPAFFFLAKFLAIYIAGNLIYGIFVESFGAKPDPITFSVTQQSALVLSWLGEETYAEPNNQKPTVFLRQPHEIILSVYEGCNGVNVMIVFTAFVIAFGGKRKSILLFIPVGLLIIHLCNLLRILLLYYVSLNFESYFYFVHKYFFTAILYVIVCFLWAIWIFYFHARTRNNV